MPPKQDNVQKLLAAEEKRNKLIADAKNRKQQKVKQAKADAEREVASFRAERDAEYEQYRTQQNSGADAEHAELARATDKELEELKTMTAQRMNSVADKMAALVVNVIESVFRIWWGRGRRTLRLGVVCNSPLALFCFSHSIGAADAVGRLEREAICATIGEEGGG